MAKESEEIKRRRELYDQHRLQAWTDVQAMSDQIDKSILTFSTAGLGLSVTFLREQAVTLGVAIKIILCLSWLAFAFAILATIFSFGASMKAQMLSLEHYRKYYMEGLEEFGNARNKFADRNNWLVGTAISSFVIAIILTIVLAVGVLFSSRAILSDSQTQANPQMNITHTSVTNDLEKGRVSVPVTPVPAFTPAPTPIAPLPTGSSETSKK